MKTTCIHQLTVMAAAIVMTLAACDHGRLGGALTTADKDSDAYYLEMSQCNKAYYAAMKTDSFDMTSRQIGQYLQCHRHSTRPALRQLRTDWLMARSVYFTAILGRPDSGVVYAQHTLESMEQSPQNLTLRVMALTNLGDFYRQLGQFDRSADSYLQALAATDSLTLSTQERIAVMLGISTTYTFMADYSTSNEWWTKTERLLTDMTEADQFIYYNNRGNDYYLQRRYVEALPCFERAADIVRGDERKAWDYYTALTNIGEIYVCLGNASHARPYIEQADSFFHRVDFGILIYYIATSKMKLALLEGRTADALSMARSSQIPAQMIPAAKVMRLEAVEHIMAETGHYQEAYDAHREWHALTDSIQTTQVRMQMSARLLQYQHDKQLLEQRRLAEHNHMTARLAWALLVIALLLMTLLLILYVTKRRRQRLQAMAMRQKIVAMRMENTRNRITPHFIYNALNHEMLAQMKGEAVDFTALTQLLRRGLAMADVLQTSLQEELAFVDYYVGIEGQQLGPGFHYEKDVAPGVDTAAVSLPAMTIQIFVENAIKHGLRQSMQQEKLLTIRISRQNNATLVEVMDNGQGPATTSAKGTGLRIVSQTLQLLNDHNHTAITYGVEPRQSGGCRSWLLLPDDYNYSLT